MEQQFRMGLDQQRQHDLYPYGDYTSMHCDTNVFINSRRVSYTNSTHQASPSFILTMPSFSLRSDALPSDPFGADGLLKSSGSAGNPGPSLLISTFLFIAAVADDDKSLAITYLRRKQALNEINIPETRRMLTSQEVSPSHNE